MGFACETFFLLVDKRYHPEFGRGPETILERESAIRLTLCNEIVKVGVKLVNGAAIAAL